jgi:hypothetical protein
VQPHGRIIQGGVPGDGWNSQPATAEAATHKQIDEDKVTHTFSSHSHIPFIPHSGSREIHYSGRPQDPSLR